MRDERKKQARSNKQTRQSNTYMYCMFRGCSDLVHVHILLTIHVSIHACIHIQIRTVEWDGIYVYMFNYFTSFIPTPLCGLEQKVLAHIQICRCVHVHVLH